MRHQAATPSRAWRMWRKMRSRRRWCAVGVQLTLWQRCPLLHHAAACKVAARGWRRADGPAVLAAAAGCRLAHTTRCLPIHSPAVQLTKQQLFCVGDGEFFEECGLVVSREMWRKREIRSHTKHVYQQRK